LYDFLGVLYSICAGAATCVEGLPSVFNSDDSNNWIFPDEESNERIIESIKKCPSGALSYSIGMNIYTDDRVTPRIDIIKDGPYNVEGIKLEGFHTPSKFSETKYSLCRCGHSKNKPYCDYSHAESNWSDE